MRFKRGFKNLYGLFYSLVCLFLILQGSGCVRTSPLDFKRGEYRCEFCQMDIVDLRFKAEILSPKGKVHRFDSIECLEAWGFQHPEETATRWVTSFYHPEKWLPMEKALFLKADRLSSPMGASLSAYETEEELGRALREFGGRKMSLNELESFIQHEWRKEIIPGENH